MSNHFDYLVIGGGSGGIASARRAAAHGARTAIIENASIGGTCVNVGCVPKKVMWNTASIAEVLHLAKDYGFDADFKGFDWGALKQKRDTYVERLNDIYHRDLDASEVTEITGTAHFKDARTVVVNDQSYSAEHILIATGSTPVVPDLPGAEHGITNAGFFELEKQPKHTVIVGSGYIAVEFAGLLQSLGTRVTMLLRGEFFLRNFDASIREVLIEEMIKAGVHIQTSSNIRSIDKDSNGQLTIHYNEEESLGHIDTLIWAIGRGPLTAPLALANTGVRLDSNGYIETDRWQNTSVNNIYAVGDVTGRTALTPVAIAAGRKLAERLFAGQKDARLDYDNIASVVFSHPPIGTVGLTEEAAREKFGESAVRIYESRFINMLFAITGQKSPTLVKLVTVGDQEKIVGCHIIGMAADEIIQGFAVAVKMGALKRDLDNTVAIHPTAAEELVTLR